jgi:hypothetical protein
MDVTRLAGQTFTQAISVELRTVEDYTIPVPAELSYSTSDPYAVTVSFQLHDRSVPWTFGRDLLSLGLHEPAGEGDVHVFPCLSDDGLAVVTVELCSPHGDALVEIRTQDAADFVERSHALVPPGQEFAHLDVDAAISAIRTAENA